MFPWHLPVVSHPGHEVRHPARKPAMIDQVWPNDSNCWPCLEEQLMKGE